MIALILRKTFSLRKAQHIFYINISKVTHLKTFWFWNMKGNDFDQWSLCKDDTALKNVWKIRLTCFLVVL